MRGILSLLSCCLTVTCDCSYVSSKYVRKCKPEWITSTGVLVTHSSFSGHCSHRDVQSHVYNLKVLDDKGDVIHKYMPDEVQELKKKNQLPSKASLANEDEEEDEEDCVFSFDAL